MRVSYTCPLSEHAALNHPIGVAELLAIEAGICDEATILAAVLHDTVEDTQTAFDELKEHFGCEVSDLVREVTDDKKLEKAERKRLQIEHAPLISTRAKQLNIADLTCNIRDVTNCPPTDWLPQRRLDYLRWCNQVVAGCRGVNPKLETIFDAAMERARKALDSGT